MSEPDGPDLAALTRRLQAVPGVLGVVLGGSRARGSHRPDSDYDIGVYYSADALDLPALATAAREADDGHRPDLIAPPGGWGNWVDGGGWLTIAGKPVDLILRDLARVEQAVADCLSGTVHAHYQPGHPHAFINVMYAGELAIARPLWDPARRLQDLQSQLIPYPAALRQALIHLFDFEAGFSLMLAKNYANGADLYYVAAHITRAISCLNQVLFAINGEFCLNEKGAVALIENFALKPSKYQERIAAVIADAGRNAPAACAMLEALVAETRRDFAGLQ